MKKIILTALAVATLGLAMSACDVPEDKADAPSKAEVKDATKVKATKILGEFERNEAKADTKYSGKVLQISGVVDEVDTELLDTEQYTIQLAGGGQFEMFTVNCDDQTNKVASGIKVGKPLTVVGKFEDGGDLGIELEGCQVVGA